jgi:hypothetical protein
MSSAKDLVLKVVLTLEPALRSEMEIVNEWKEVDSGC